MNKKLLNIVFILQLVVVGLVVSGIISRFAVPYFVLLLAIYFIWAPLEDGTVFFVRSIPFFIAIPLTMHFDSLNTWRVLSIVLFLKWLEPTNELKNGFPKIKKFFAYNKERRVYLVLMTLLILSVASILVSTSHTLAIKRIVYFINLSLIGIIVYDLASKSLQFRIRLAKNIAVPVVLVTLLGFIQLATTYLMDIFRFIEFWGEIVELNLFGSAWSAIVTKANTWFAYFGSQLSLRMFSIFPDSHSFPTFLLLGLPSLFALSLTKILDKPHTGLKSMLMTRASLLIVFVPTVFLALILSGTRGIWVGGGGVVLVAFIWLIIFRKYRVEKEKISIFKYLSSYLVIFFLLFSVALPIIASPQFLLAKDSALLLGNRFRSIIDAGETSNKRRLEIWNASVQSIAHRPILGVGISNFPVVVGEDLAKAKAGSTAHNLYLNIAAEMGIPALLVALYFLWLLIKKTYGNFRGSTHSNTSGQASNFWTIYYGASLLFIPWVLFYSMTDAILFDERVFLLFGIICAVIFSQSSIKSEQVKNPK